MRSASLVMTANPVVVRPDETFERCARAMRYHAIRHLVVTTATGKLAGLIRDIDVFEHGLFHGDEWIPNRPNLQGASIAAAVRPVDVVDPKAPFQDLLRQLIAVDEDVVVVVDETRAPLGVFTETDAVRLAAAELPEDLQVSRVMATELVTATPDMPLQDAWDELVANDIRHLPIREGSRLVGVASMRDFVWVGSSVAAGGTVGQLVHADRPLHTTSASVSMREASAKMAKHRIGCLPVLDDRGALVGLVTATDAIKALLA
jgi:acetoin utilization protein AcuB